jgi:hypothetical protein
VKEADAIKLQSKNFRDTGFSLKFMWYLAFSNFLRSGKAKKQPVEEMRSLGRGNKVIERMFDSVQVTPTGMLLDKQPWP